MPANDVKRLFPRFQPDVFDENVKLVDEVRRIAEKKGCTTAQVALGWVCAQRKKVGTTVLPIPGSSRVEGIRENADVVELGREGMKQLQEVLGRIEIRGERYPEKFRKYLEV
jgi:pyridoxine 4-dehydrogenase